MSKISERIIVLLLAVMAVFSILSYVQSKKASDNIDLIEYGVSDLRIWIIDLQNKFNTLLLDMTSMEVWLDQTNRLLSEMKK